MSDIAKHESSEARRKQIAEAAEQYLDDCIAEVIHDWGYEDAVIEAVAEATDVQQVIMVQALCEGDATTAGNVLLDIVRHHVIGEAKRRALEIAEREYE